MTVQLHLVRHGQTDWNVEGRFQGQADPPLNATGLAQAEALAAALVLDRHQALYTSDLARARQTAAALAERTGLAARLEPRLREVHHGQWDGLLLAEIVGRFPDDWAERERLPETARPPGGETVREVAARVGAALDDIARRHPAGSVLVVSHGLALATALCRARGLPLGRAPELIPPHATLVTVEWTPG
jgi:broad specificity phosphatase PhoE